MLKHLAPAVWLMWLAASPLASADEVFWTENLPESLKLAKGCYGIVSKIDISGGAGAAATCAAVGASWLAYLEFSDSGSMCAPDDLVVFYEGNDCTEAITGSLTVKDLDCGGGACTCHGESAFDKSCFSNDEGRSLLIKAGFPRGGIIWVCNNPDACSSDDHAVIIVKDVGYAPTAASEAPAAYCVTSFMTSYEDAFVKVEYRPVDDDTELDGKVSRASACRPEGSQAPDAVQVFDEWELHACFDDPGDDRLYTASAPGLSLANCAFAAKTNGFVHFGMQCPSCYAEPGYAECWIDPASQSIDNINARWRPLYECLSPDDDVGSYPLGSEHRNAVYKRKGEYLTDWETPPYQYYACFVDPAEDRHFTDFVQGVDKAACARIAYNAGSDWFGLQFPQGYDGYLAECWYGQMRAMPGQEPYTQILESECTVEPSPYGPNGGANRNAIYRFATGFDVGI